MRQTKIDEFLELEHHNKELEKRIKEEVAKNREKDKLMFQQAKLASLGEMLGNISHQWRQPLMEINSLFLPIEAKMIYAIYFDTMCLSKANYFTDNMERIYFQESYIEQELKSNFSNNTLKKYRNYLKACNLLYEYQPFGQKMRYYLIKLDMYEDNVFIYEQLEDVDKSIFKAAENVNLDCVLGWQQHGESFSFLDEFDSTDE